MSEIGPAGTAYRGVRTRVRDLVTSGDVDAAATVPCCPSWTVADVVAHLAGVVDDALAGRLDGVATDPWTQAQVDSRRGRPVDDVLDEWDGLGPTFEAVLDSFGPAGWQAVFDATTHEHDVRGALARPGARDSDAVLGALAFAVEGMAQAAAARGTPVPRLVSTDGRSWGDDGAPASLTASPFELMRSLSGRRSLEQIAALDWSGDVDAVLPAFTWGPFRPSSAPISE